ncbi:MAG: hypothetical protein HC836_47125 [Richelia sp. RM2_1_2]|nr:hypothetical protein [Richelia sp. RM1_1_1]NJO65406.1 hypothetical protein [Richelia sp. RM2_1_2]
MHRDFSLQLHPGFDPNRYYTYPEIGITSNRGDAGYANNLYFNFIQLPNCQIQSISCVIASGFVGNSSIYLSIYNVENNYPKIRLATVNIPINSDGVKEAIINLNAKSGYYALSYLASANYIIKSLKAEDTNQAGYFYGLNNPTGALECGLRFDYQFEEPPEIFNISNFNRSICNRSPMLYLKLK